MVGLGHPVDDHVGLEVGQDIVAQHALGPGDRGVLGIGGAAAHGRRPEALKHLVAHGLGQRDARFPIAVDQHADAAGRARICEQRRPGRARRHRGEPLAALPEDFAQALGQDHAAAGDLVEAEQHLVVVIAEGVAGIDGAHIDGVADHAAAAGPGAGRDRGRIDAGDGRKHRMAVDEIDALPPQPPQIRRFLRGDGVRAQAVEHQDDVEGRAAGIGRDRSDGQRGREGDGRTRHQTAHGCSPRQGIHTPRTLPVRHGSRSAPGAGWLCARGHAKFAR